MKLVLLALAGVGAALLVAAIASTDWDAPGVVTANAGPTPTPTPTPTRARESTPSANTSLAPVQSPQASAALGSLADIKNLAARCQIAMLQDVCGVMTSSKPNGDTPNTERLFIAGVGEVDAKVFNRLREAGDKMCGEVEIECVVDWAGSGCKIARAMYPA